MREFWLHLLFAFTVLFHMDFGHIECFHGISVNDNIEEVVATITTKEGYQYYYYWYRE